MSSLETSVWGYMSDSIRHVSYCVRCMSWWLRHLSYNCLSTLVSYGKKYDFKIPSNKISGSILVILQGSDWNIPTMAMAMGLENQS